MANMYMNGDKPFIHPVSGQLVGAYAWYEGAAHVESEQSDASVEEDAAAESPLDDLSHNKLKQMAKEAGVDGWSTKTKEELAELLKAGE